MLATGQLYAAIPLLGVMGREWHTGASTMAWIASAFGFGYAVGFLLWGPLSGRLGRRRVIVWGTAATVATTALVAVAAGSPGTGIPLRALQGITTGAFAPAAFAYIAERIEPRRRGVVLATVIAGFLAAAVAGQLVAQLVGGSLGWRAVFWVFAALFALAAVLLRTVMLPDAPSAGPAARLRDAYRPIPRLLTDRRLAPLYAATPLVMLAFVALYTGLQLAGVASDPATMLALRAAALPGVVAVPFVTGMLRGVPAVVRSAGAAALLGVSVLVIGVAGGAVGVAGIAVLLNLVVLGAGLAAAGLNEAVGGRAGEARRGTAVSLFTFVLFLGSSVGPQVAAALAGGGLAELGVVLAALLGVAVVLSVAASRR
ncbi:hypothetical protein BIV57_10285 [Mangrovactinospora gilvigrisea]|uniref:Major facilitator superfamily (MFS) profile domain-containing protein n=2 Tax=Mangrovactinospora gilvigrisea TaxID=1428644 RepID=A0A1J7BG96_9ACTN|nr:hypothetical protein BIV57_10285 [Mangrovactinospora gilvigrisea]